MELKNCQNSPIAWRTHVQELRLLVSSQQKLIRGQTSMQVGASFKLQTQILSKNIREDRSDRDDPDDYMQYLETRLKTGPLTGCSGAELHPTIKSASAAFWEHFLVILKNYQEYFANFPLLNNGNTEQNPQCHNASTPWSLHALWIRCILLSKIKGSSISFFIVITSVKNVRWGRGRSKADVRFFQHLKMTPWYYFSKNHHHFIAF